MSQPQASEEVDTGDAGRRPGRGRNARRGWWAAAVVAGIVLAAYAASKAIDFRVYHLAARGYFWSGLSMYGPASGLGWPMHYRYPPLFLFLFWPLALLPLRWAAAVWALAKLATLAWLARSLGRRLGLPAAVRAWLVPLLLTGPYLFLELRYGQAQFFVFALLAAGLLVRESRPWLASGLVALAVSLKVWPVFFLPYLAARGSWRVSVRASALAVLLALLPAAYCGWDGNIELLRDWTTQELAFASGTDELFYPSQSVRGVLMRYLAEIDYAQAPDRGYPFVALAHLPATLVLALWVCLAAAAYVALLVLARRGRDVPESWAHGVAICGLVLLQPFTHKTALCVLLWPAIVAGRLIVRRETSIPVRALIWSALALVLGQTLAPGAALQRTLQALGADTAVVLLLGLALVVACLGGRRPSLLAPDAPIPG